MTMRVDRRRFLRAAGALSAGALFPALAAWAPPRRAQAADYRALVCVFLYGGNDGNNMVVPYDDYGKLRGRAQRRAPARRSAAASSCRSRRRDLARKYGLHPNLAPLVPLFEQGKLAVVANVGTLVGAAHARRVPVRRSRIRATSSRTATSSRRGRGWCRASRPRADGAAASSMSPAPATPRWRIPGMVSLSGDALFTIGVTSLPVALSRYGALGLAGDRYSDTGRVRYDAMTQILALDRDNQLQRKRGRRDGAGGEEQRGAVRRAQRRLQRHRHGVPGRQRRPWPTSSTRCAKLIAAQSQLGVSRQGFFTSMGGFDTHNDAARRAGVALQRTGAGACGVPAGDGGARCRGQGHDVHAVGLRPDVPHQRQCRQRPRMGRPPARAGRRRCAAARSTASFPISRWAARTTRATTAQWIPTTSIEQYGATLARWFGVPAAALPQVFPNLGAFASADLGFMS